MINHIQNCVHNIQYVRVLLIFIMYMNTHTHVYI